MNCLDNMDQTIISTDPSKAANVYGLIAPSFGLSGTDPNMDHPVELGSVQYFSQK